MSQAPIVLDPAAAAAFHSPSNISLGCRQVAPLFYPHSCRHFTADFFEQRHFHMRGGSGGDTQLHRDTLRREFAQRGDALEIQGGR